MSRKPPVVSPLVLTIALLVSMLPFTSPAFGQELVTGAATEISVSAGGTWVHDTAASLSDGVVDTLVFSNGNANFVVSAGTPDPSHMLATLPADSRYSDIDAGAGYALRYVNLNDVVYRLFSVVVGNTVQTIIAPSDAFAAAVGDAQANILVDGAPVLSGVDGAALAASVPDGSGTDLPLIGSGAPAAAAGTTAEPAEAGSESTETLAVPGLEDNAYVAPWSALRITWTDDWQVLTVDGQPVIGGSAGDVPYDQICLASTQHENMGVCIYIAPPGERDNATDWELSYAAPEAMSDYGTPYYAVKVTESSVVLATSGVDGTVATVSQFEVVGDYLISTQVIGTMAELPDLAVLANSGVQIGDQPAMAALDLDQFRSETEAMIAKLPELQAERDAYLAALGLVDANHYVSVAMGCDVQWTSPLALTNMVTFYPVTQEVSSLIDPAVAAEVFILTATDAVSAYASVSVTCLQNVPSLDSWPTWLEAREGPYAADYHTVEGADAFYVIDVAGGNLNVIVKPLGGPTVLVALSSGPGGFAPVMQSMQPGVLIINGVDVFQAMEDDGITSQLP